MWITSYVICLKEQILLRGKSSKLGLVYVTVNDSGLLEIGYLDTTAA